VDAEELAEFQFDFFLPRLNVILNKRNFNLEVKTADNYETSNEVFLNGEKIQLYTKDELENSDFWDKASRTFFKKLNDLLKKGNLNESFFLLYNGNDSQHFYSRTNSLPSLRTNIKMNLKKFRIDLDLGHRKKTACGWLPTTKVFMPLCYRFDVY
jgi:hypothetical protein